MWFHGASNVLQGYPLPDDPAMDPAFRVNAVISHPHCLTPVAFQGPRETIRNKERIVESMAPVAIVTVLALLQLFVFAFQVGKQRVKHEIKAPAISGEAEFERAFRVHQNTL